MPPPLAALEAPVDTIVFDIAGDDSVATTVAALGDGPSFDLVAITAGISAVGRFEALDRERLAEVVAVNLTGPMVLATALLQAGMIANEGRVVFVSSLSYFVGYPGASVYAATKQWPVAFARSIRGELWRDFGVTVQVVAPGRWIQGAPSATPRLAQGAAAGQVPMQRLPRSCAVPPGPSLSLVLERALLRLPAGCFHSSPAG